MKRITLKAGNRALRVIVASSALAASLITSPGARADEAIGIVLSASPSGTATKALAMRIPAESHRATIPMFVSQATGKTLFSVRFSATPLIDGKGQPSVTPTFDRDTRTIPSGGDLVRFDVTVSGLTRLGTFTSRLYAVHGGRTQVLGQLTVVHALKSGALQIASIDPARGDQALPGMSTGVVLLVNVRNNGDGDLSFTAPTLARLTIDGATTSPGDLPAARVADRDGNPAAGPWKVAAGDGVTLRVVLDGVKRTGEYKGSLRLSAVGHDPVEQSFAFAIKQGPVFPALLIALGVAIAYGLRRLFASGRIGRAGQKRLVARLVSDLHAARSNAGEVEPREALVFETLERRLVDVSDRLERARAGKNAEILSEIDHKIDLLSDLVFLRGHIGGINPGSLQVAFDSRLDDVAGFLKEMTPSRELAARFDVFAKVTAEMPQAIEAAVADRFQVEVERLMAGVDTSSTVSTAIPLAVLKRVEGSRALSGEGRFKDARSELAAAQLIFARLLAEDMAARLPDADAGPPGFVTGWPRFRAATLEGLRAVRRERRGEHAAERYRRVWQEYVGELLTRLRASAARERRQANGSRKEQLSKVIEACDEASSKAMDLDPATVDAYLQAVEGFLAPLAQKRSTRFRAMLEEAQFPPPMTVVSAWLGTADRVARPAPGGLQSAASLTRLIRKRHLNLALVAGVAAIPAGLVLFWAPNDTWGALTDGAAVFGWGLGLPAVASTLDAGRLGWAVARKARKARPRETSRAPAAASSARGMQPEREPAS